jgi:hypothetical protein
MLVRGCCTAVQNRAGGGGVFYKILCFSIKYNIGTFFA